MSDLALFYQERTFTITTTPVAFADWLEQHTETTIIPIVPERGYYLTVRQFSSPIPHTRLEKLTGRVRLAITGAKGEPDPQCPEASIQTHTEVIAFNLLPLGDGRVEIKASCGNSFAMDFFGKLLREIVLAWPEVREDPQLVVSRSIPDDTEAMAAKCGPGPTARTQARGDVFKCLKDAHPTWSQARVAMEASKEEELNEQVTEATVRNTYRLLGWKWERADRIR